MINTNKIVPVTNVDLLTLYAVIYGNAAISGDGNGNFEITEEGTTATCNEPVKTINLDVTASSLASATVNFVADYDYEGIKIDGVFADPADGSDEVIKNAADLYQLEFGSGEFTITKLT